MSNDKQMKIRVPQDVWLWLKEQAARFGGTLNSEVTRAVRERMDREATNAR